MFVRTDYMINFPQLAFVSKVIMSFFLSLFDAIMKAVKYANMRIRNKVSTYL